MSWISLALHLTAATACHVSSTNPNSLPPKAQIRGPVLDAAFVKVWPSITKVFWLPAVSEALIILALKYPSPTSSWVLAALGYSTVTFTTQLSPTLVAGTALAIIGAIGRVTCYRALGRHFTYQLHLHRSHALVTDGPYGIVRHPSYLVLMMSMTGVALVNAREGSWIRAACALDWLRRSIAILWVVSAAILWSILFRRLNIEDDFLHHHFGKEWEEWAARVRYKLIPGVL